MWLSMDASNHIQSATTRWYKNILNSPTSVAFWAMLQVLSRLSGDLFKKPSCAFVHAMPHSFKLCNGEMIL